MHLLQAAHAVALLVFAVVPFMALSQALQAFVVDLDARGNGGTRRVVPEDVTHVVQQARGRQQDIGRRQIFLSFHAVEEISGVFAAVLLRHGKPILCGFLILWNALAHEGQLAQQILCVGVSIVRGLPQAISKDVRKGKYAAQGMPKLIENYVFLSSGFLRPLSPRSR